ncbi:MAG: carboxypeptidase M32 [Chloroflexota bacterium]
MEEKLAQLKEILGEINDLNMAGALLGWDQQTLMPEGGTEARGYQLGTLGKLAHIRFTSEEVGQLLEDLAPYAEQLDPNSDDARLIRVTRRDYDKQTRVPAEWVAAFAQETTRAHPVWQAARAEKDFSKFRPTLEKLFELRRQYAQFFAPYDHIYDPLLDDFEPGLKTADVQAIFTALRPQQVALIQAIAERPEVDDSFIYQFYNEQKQWDFGVEVITQFGYDWKRGRQDKSPHPFTTHFSIGDVRITTRFDTQHGTSALFSTMHEAGHALYEMGVDPALERTPLANGASLAVHESQSRLWENLVGRSRPFWEHFYPRLQEYFPSQLGNLSLDDYYRGVNKVTPSLIRVEADEATYNLHIMLRLELEIALMEGSLAVKDLPEAWNTRMQEYLGILPPDDSKGVLQDVHWSMGLIGYFSTYALGNLISAQLWERIRAEIPDLDDQIRRGQFSALLAWLVENIHRHGSKFEPQELVQQVTGSKIDPAAYVRYLQTKFGEIYGL